jgi:hypothetical protein
MAYTQEEYKLRMAHSEAMVAALALKMDKEERMSLLQSPMCVRPPGVLAIMEGASKEQVRSPRPSLCLLPRPASARRALGRWLGSHCYYNAQPRAHSWAGARRLSPAAAALQTHFAMPSCFLPTPCPAPLPHRQAC